MLGGERDTPHCDSCAQSSAQGRPAAGRQRARTSEQSMCETAVAADDPRRVAHARENGQRLRRCQNGRSWQHACTAVAGRRVHDVMVRGPPGGRRPARGGQALSTAGRQAAACLPLRIDPHALRLGHRDTCVHRARRCAVRERRVSWSVVVASSGIHSRHVAR